MDLNFGELKEQSKWKFFVGVSKFKLAFLVTKVIAITSYKTVNQ